MSRKTEDRAKEYLIQSLNHERYGFSDRQHNESGFDLWMEDRRSKQRVKVELKATEGKYRRPSDVFQKLYFSAENEIENFKCGVTRIVRVFLGDNPPRVCILDRGIFDLGAHFETEFRAKIVGQKNYSGIFWLDC